WVQTRTEARASRAPAPVIERIDSVVAAIDASAARLQKERTATLVLQDRVVQEVARCEPVLTRITEMRHSLGEQVLVQDTPPIWRVDQLTKNMAEAPARFRAAVANDIGQIGPSLRAQSGRVLLQVVLFIALLLFVRAARRRARGWASQDQPAS